jgi:hypothetical protein
MNNTQPSQERSEPKLTLVIANPLFPQPVLDTAGNAVQGQYRASVEPVVWGIGSRHPFVQTMKIECMFIDGDLIEVYSTDGKIGMRDLIPMSTVRLAEEGMPLDTYEEEIDLSAARSAGEDLEDPEPDPEPEDESPPQQVSEQAPS